MAQLARHRTGLIESRELACARFGFGPHCPVGGATALALPLPRRRPMGDKNPKATRGDGFAVRAPRRFGLQVHLDWWVAVRSVKELLSGEECCPFGEEGRDVLEFVEPSCCAERLVPERAGVLGRSPWPDVRVGLGDR